MSLEFVSTSSCYCDSAEMRYRNGLLTNTGVARLVPEWDQATDLRSRGWLQKEWSTSAASVRCQRGLSLSRNFTSMERKISHCVIWEREGEQRELLMSR